MPATFGGLLRKQDSPSGFGGADPNAFAPAALLNGRNRLASNSAASAASDEFGRRSGSRSGSPAPAPQPEAYAAMLGRSPSAAAAQNGGRAGDSAAGGVSGSNGGGGDYMAAMGGDWWKTWNAAPASGGAQNPATSAAQAPPPPPPGAAGFGPAGPAAFRSSSMTAAEVSGPPASGNEVLVVDLPPGHTPPTSRSPSPTQPGEPACNTCRVPKGYTNMTHCTPSGVSLVHRPPAEGAAAASSLPVTLICDHQVCRPLQQAEATLAGFIKFTTDQIVADLQGRSIRRRRAAASSRTRTHGHRRPGRSWRRDPAAQPSPLCRPSARSVAAAGRTRRSRRRRAAPGLHTEVGCKRRSAG